MISFEQILGQGHIVKHFRNAIETGKTAHAYILNGEDGSGKRTLAGVFAAALQCEADQGRPCGVCHSCKQCESGSQPDIHWITHEKPNTISVDDVREQLNGDIVIRPYSSPYKIYIIDEAEKLNAAAQNAILKTIEEPPAYAVILFLTNNAAAFLPTVMSRCVLLNIRPVGERQIQEYLMKEKQIPDYQAKIAARFSGGNVGKAVWYAVSEQFEALKSSALHILRHAKEMSIEQLVASVEDAGNYKADIYDYLNLMTMWYRDVLLFKAVRDVDGLLFGEELREIRRQASLCGFDGLQEILEALDKAKVRLRANVNFELTMQLLFMTIHEKMRNK